MEVILNGDAQQFDPSSCTNLAELVSAAGQAGQAGEDANENVIIGIEVDGRALDPEELSALESLSLQGVLKVSIQERPATDVARSVLDQAADYTGEICQAIAATVEHYRSGRSDLGAELLANVTDSMSVLTGITYSVSNVLLRESEILAAVQSKIYPWLEELVEAQSAEDPIRIADALEYEVAPRIEEWGTTMRKLKNGTQEFDIAGEAPHSN
ncbi:MAG: hypothetical protein AB8G23_22730 [Myxococcota bacterium]